MTENNKPYHLRLKEAFSWYDIAGSQMFHTWEAGAVLTDPAQIALIESRGIAADKIFEGEFRR
jgi:hypothetical protein